MRDTKLSNASLTNADGCCALITKGTTPPKSEMHDNGAVPFVRVNNLGVGGGIGLKGEIIYVSQDAHNGVLKRSKAYPGDTLMNIVGPPLGKIAKIDGTFPEYNLNQAVVIFRPNRAVIDEDFLFYYVSSIYAQNWLQARSKKTSGQQNLTIELCKQLPMPQLLLSEQRKIGTVLRTWDDAIEKLCALRNAKTRRLEALRGELLFKASNWPMRRLAEVTRELTSRNGQLGLERSTVMGVTNSRGIIPMREQTVAGDISRYKLLPPQGFAYNPMRINVGSIAMNAREETFLVSPDYVVFACRPEGLEPAYLNHLRQTRWWLHHINAGGSGSVRHRTYYDDLAALQLHLPDIAKQRSIVAVLNAAQTDVDLTEREITALTRQKRGLMQKLLTGEWAVKVEGETP